MCLYDDSSNIVSLVKVFICIINKQDSLAKRAKLLTSGITHLGGPARHSYKHFINIIKEINRKKTIAGLSRLGGLSHFARPARPCNKGLSVGTIDNPGATLREIIKESISEKLNEFKMSFR